MVITSLKCEVDISEADVDSDTVNEETLSTIFEKGTLLVEKAVLENSFVLHLTGTVDTQPTVAAALSNSEVYVLKYDNEQLSESAILREDKGLIVGVKFSGDHKQNLFTASSNGVIKLWDLRCSPKKSVLEFIDASREEQKDTKPFVCFDVSPNNRLLICGTELYDGDAFLLFWDVRNTKLLGGYWESHTDDITEVKFHPEDSDKLISGSTDGLINLYDLSQPCEDDALIETFNTESSVASLTWFKINQADSIACTTHTDDLQLWNTEAAEPYAHFGREKICTAIKRSSETYAYLGQVHVYNSNLLVLAGSTYGDGECARALFAQNRTLQPVFDLNGNKQIIRSSWCNPHVNLLATGGENGIVNMWRLNVKR